jgi:hypothetical protein
MKKGFAYRFLVILVVYLFLGAVILGSLASSGTLPAWELWTFLGVFLGAFVLTVAINEYVIYRRKKKAE